MKKTASRPLCLTLVVVLILTILVTGYLTFLNIESPTLSAENGFIRVADAAMSGGPYMLTGEWQRIPGALTPAEMEMEAPSYVQDIRYIRKMRGYTYRFTLVTKDDLYFAMNRPLSSKLWVNGVQVDNDQGELSSNDIFRLLDYGTGEYVFTLQVASLSIYDVYQGVLVGSRNLLANIQTRWMALDLVAVGLFLMLAVFCLALFVKKRSETYLPLLALSAMTELIQFLLIARNPLLQLTGWGTVTLYRQFAFLNYFILKQLFPSASLKWMNRLVYGLIVGSVLGCLLFPQSASQILRFVLVGHLMVQLCLIVRASREGGAETLLIGCGWAVQAGVELFYLLLNVGILPQGVVDVQVMPAQYARLVYLMAISIAICFKYSEKFSQANQLSDTLENQVREKTSELIEINAHLKETTQKRQQFMTDIVHNLRSPLMSLNGYMELLQSELPNPTPQQAEYLTLIDRKLNHVGHMVDDMFFLTRLEDERITFNFTQSDTVTILNDAIQENSALVGSKKISFRCEAKNAEILCDRFRLRQALDNLIDNAVRYSPEDGVITLGCKIENKQAILFVQDQGPGIPSEQIPRLFERYVSKGMGGSTGLGLSICRYIMIAHGGRIFVESTVGQGATFFLSLPLADADDEK